MTPQTTRIIRYSTQGFKPQYQSEHLKNINYHLNDFNINDFPEHLRYIIQKQHEEHLSFYKEHYQDFQYGNGSLKMGIKTIKLLIIWNIKYHVGKLK